MTLAHKLKHLALFSALTAAAWGAQAATLDLTSAGASGTLNGGVYTQVGPQGTGSGAINSFVRIGAANQDVVQAYNTTATTSFDNQGGATFNHAITVGQLGLPPGGSNTLMHFLLDINQTSASPLLNLDEVQIFLSTTPDQSTTAFNAGVLALGNAALVYRMDAGADNTVTLDYSLNPGSGGGDMTLDLMASVLDPAFAALGLTTDAQKNGAFIYLYSKFGSAPNPNNDGFEEWAYLTPAATRVPEPGTVALLASGLLGAVLMRGRPRLRRV